MLKYFKIPYIQQTHFMQFLLNKHQPQNLSDMLELTLTFYGFNLT